MNENTDYINAMERQLNQWDAEVDELQTRGRQLAAEARAAYFAHLKELRTHREAVQKTFEQIRRANESTAAKLQGDMEHAWENLRAALEQLSVQYAPAARRQPEASQR
jgi:chromosome segregation ATPase